MRSSGHDLLAAGFHAEGLEELEPWFELEFRPAGVVQVTFEPLLLDRGAFALGIYEDHQLVTPVKVLVDVKGTK